jgi:hypothetical protein
MEKVRAEVSSLEFRKRKAGISMMRGFQLKSKK